MRLKLFQVRLWPLHQNFNNLHLSSSIELDFAIWCRCQFTDQSTLWISWISFLECPLESATTYLHEFFCVFLNICEAFSCMAPRVRWPWLIYQEWYTASCMFSYSFDYINSIFFLYKFHIIYSNLVSTYYIRLIAI